MEETTAIGAMSVAFVVYPNNARARFGPFDGDGLTFSDLPHVQDIAKMNASPSQPRNRKSTD
jgi:hypothetical protein